MRKPGRKPNWTSKRQAKLRREKAECADRMAPVLAAIRASEIEARGKVSAPVVIPPPPVTGR